MTLANSIQTLKEFAPFLKPYKAQFGLASLYSFFKKLFDIAPEILIGVAIDVVVNKKDSILAQFGVVEPLDQLFVLSFFTLLIWLFESLFEYLLLVQWKKLAQFLQHDLRSKAYSHLQVLDFTYFETESAGSTTTLLTEDVNQLERFFNEGVDKFIQIATSVVLIGAVFIWISPVIALMAFIPMPFVFWGSLYFQKKMGPLYEAVRDRGRVLGGRISSNIEGISTVRSFCQEGFEEKRISQASSNYVEANEAAIRLSSRFTPSVRMGVLAGFLGTFVYGGYLALNGELAIGLYGVLVFLTQRLLWPLRDLAGAIDLFERAMASTSKVLSLLRTPIMLEKKKDKMVASASKEISFQEVSFGYAKNSLLFEQLSFEVKPGTTTAVVGPTGSGKSSLVKLILGFYGGYGGKILVGGSEVSEVDPRSIRAEVSLVSQDVHLFPGTIFENVRYGRPQASVENVKMALEKAQILSFIEGLPKGIKTLVGERSLRLSGGQRQRVSLARAILKDAPIVILDEATSALDNETEAAIRASLSENLKGKTCLMIAHRLSSVVHADQILVLDRGRILSRGRHDELLKTSEIYREMWARQTR